MAAPEPRLSDLVVEMVEMVKAFSTKYKKPLAIPVGSPKFELMRFPREIREQVYSYILGKNLRFTRGFYIADLRHNHSRQANGFRSCRLNILISVSAGQSGSYVGVLHSQCLPLACLDYVDVLDL